MKFLLSATILFGLLGGAAQAAPAQDKAKEEAHQHDVTEKGDHVMGFSHDKATHHFRLYADGGAIEVQANDAKDTATRDAIRGHFSHITKMFAAGDFTAPILIHSQNPPGSDVMKRLRDKIDYHLENAAAGSRIRITTKDAEALKAVHSFLRFQISEHETGDTTELTKEAASARAVGPSEKKHSRQELSAAESRISGQTLEWCPGSVACANSGKTFDLVAGCSRRAHPSPSSQS